MIELLAGFGFIFTIGLAAVGVIYLGVALYNHVPHNTQSVLQLLGVGLIAWLVVSFYGNLSGK